jgi:hypothetical protein
MRLWATIKWVFAGVVAIGLALLAFVYGKDTIAVANAKVREREAKLRKAKLDLEAARLAAQRATNEKRKRNLIAKQDTLQTAMIEIRKDREHITKEFRRENGLTDEEYAEEVNRRRPRRRLHSES